MPNQVEGEVTGKFEVAICKYDSATGRWIKTDELMMVVDPKVAAWPTNQIYAIDRDTQTVIEIGTEYKGNKYNKEGEREEDA